MLRTRKTQPGEEKLFLAKALDFGESMIRILSSNPNSATVLAVNCVISSCDALTAKDLGEKCIEPQHGRIIELLGKISMVNQKRKQQVENVLSIKNKAEYSSRMVTPKEAIIATKQAKRFLDWTRTMI